MRAENRVHIFGDPAAGRHDKHVVEDYLVFDVFAILFDVVHLNQLLLGCLAFRHSEQHST